MQTYFLISAAVLYLVCALLPSRQGPLIAILTAIAWLLHGATLWFELTAPGSLRFGFAAMLSAALWVSVAAYWLKTATTAWMACGAWSCPARPWPSRWRRYFPAT